VTLPRKAIRNAAAAQLVAAFPGMAVHKMRFLPTADSELPCILVHTMREEAAKAGNAHGHPAFQNRLTLAVQVIVASHGSVAEEDELDDLCEGVENALLCDQAWWKSADYALEAFEAADTDIQSGALGKKRRYLAGRISLRLRHRTEFPPGPLGDLEAVRVTVLPIEPRDETQEFPPLAWREMAQIEVPKNEGE